MTNSLEKKYLSCEQEGHIIAKSYLKQTGYDILEDVNDVGIAFIAKKDNTICLVSLDVAENTRSFPSRTTTESDFEECASAYIAEHEDVRSNSVRMDSVAVILLGADKSFIRNLSGVYRLE